MKIAGELDYRNAKAVLESIAPGALDEAMWILTNPQHTIDFRKKGRQRNLSRKVQE